MDPTDAPSGASMGREPAEPHLAVGTGKRVIVVQHKHLVAAASVVTESADTPIPCLDLETAHEANEITRGLALLLGAVADRDNGIVKQIVKEGVVVAK